MVEQRFFGQLIISRLSYFRCSRKLYESELSFNSDAPVTDAGGNTFSGGGDQKWETLTSDNLLSGLTENGEYTLELFASIAANEGDKFHSDFGNNFRATFTAVPEPSALLFGGLLCSLFCMKRSR